VTRSQLEHLIRAAAGNADTTDIVIVGSQAILGTIPDAPTALKQSMEADVFPLDRPEDSILIDGAIGERSLFHETFGYYAHGVDETTVVLPPGWKERLVPIRNENTRGATGWCLDIHDLAISKLAAGREKDLDYLKVLLTLPHIDRAVLHERLRFTPFPAAELKALAEARLSRLLEGCNA
jgi:hypothetical protein